MANPARAGDHCSGAVVAVRWLARSRSRAFLVILLLVVAEGVAVLPFIPPGWIEPHTRWEVNAVAVSLATEGTFANPYALPTGPTAHTPPAFPALLALVYRIFGLTLLAGYVTWFLQVFVCATSLAMLPWLAERLGASREAGLVGGLTGALVPRSPSPIEFLTFSVEYLAAIAVALLLAWHLRVWRLPRRALAESLLLGFAWGAAFHVAPSLLPVLLGCLAFDLAWSRNRRRWSGTALTVLGVMIACVPWTARNVEALGGLLFIRSDFGLELRMGNSPAAVADIDTLDLPGPDTLRHPRTDLAEARLVQQLGELEYMRRAGRESREWIRAHPDRFIALSAQRFFYFWFGAPSRGVMAPVTALLTVVAALGLRCLWRPIEVPQRAAFVIPLLTFPPVYYVVLFMPRYSTPLIGIVLVLVGAELWGWTGAGDSRRISGSTCRSSSAATMSMARLDRESTCAAREPGRKGIYSRATCRRTATIARRPSAGRATIDAVSSAGAGAPATGPRR